MKAQDVMSSPAVTLHPERSARDAAQVLTANGFSGAPVVDGNGRLIGMVTEGDLASDRIRREAATVGQVMTRPAIEVTPDTDVRDVARTMLADRIRSMPVVDAMGVIGVVTRHDLVRLLAGDDTAR
jgi:CBS domain-containing protein